MSEFHNQSSTGDKTIILEEELDENYEPNEDGECI